MEPLSLTPTKMFVRMNLKKYSNWMPPLVALFCLLLVWELSVIFLALPSVLLPSPLTIVATTVMIVPTIWHHIFTTAFEAIVGLFCAVVIALVSAVLMDLVPLAKRALYPLIVISQTVPIINLAPLFILWFGFGIFPKIVVVVLVCFFPIVIALADSLNNVDEKRLLLMRTLGATKIQTMFFLKLPATLPSFFSALKIAATYSIMGAVIGEWLGGEAGLGVYIIRVKQSFSIEKVFAGILIITILSLIIFRLIQTIERLCLPYLNIQNSMEKK